MMEKNLRLDRSGYIEKNDSKSRTPVNLRYHQGRLEMLTPISSPLTQSNAQLKAMLKEQILKKNPLDTKLPKTGSKTPNKTRPFANKKLNLNILGPNDSGNEFQKFLHRDMSNPEITPLSKQTTPNSNTNKMAKLLKNLLPGQMPNQNPCKDTNLNLLLASLKRDNSPGRLSQRSSTSEIRKAYNKTSLTPINTRRKNGSGERSNSPKPMAPYMSIKDYLQERDKKLDDIKTMKNPGRNEKLKLTQRINGQNDLIQRKLMIKPEELKVSIKEKNENLKSTETQRKKPEFLVNVNINIENNMGKEVQEDEKNGQNLKEGVLRITQQKLSAENKSEDKEKRKNPIENSKVYDSKLAQLINSQKKAPAALITSSLNETQDKITANPTGPTVQSPNLANPASKTTQNFFDKSRNPTPQRKVSKKEEEDKKANAQKEDEDKKAKKEEEAKSENNNKSVLSSVSNSSKNENILLKEQPNTRTLTNVVMLEETLINISKGFKENQKIISCCKNYLNIVAEGNLEFFENMYESEKHRHTIKEMIILERIVVITVISLSFDKELNPKYVRNCINLLEYIHQNFIMFIELILEKVTHTSENEGLLETLKKVLILKKTRDTSRVLKSDIITKNSGIILKILQAFVKENKFEPFRTIHTLLETLDKMNITDSTQYLMQCFYSLIINLEEKIGVDDKTGVEFDDTFYAQEMSEEQLSYVAPPFIPDLPPEKKGNTYTLVIDLDETLVHYEELEDGSGQFLLRPYSEMFLAEMSKFFEVVIFTAALQDYADYILNIMDEKNQYISHRLYRKHTVHNGAIYVKDLSKLGRDLSKVIIIDNLADNFQNQPENGIFIQSWYGEPDDKALFYLAPLLKEIVLKKCEDVRVALQKFKEKMIDNINKGSSEPHKNLNLD